MAWSLKLRTVIFRKTLLNQQRLISYTVSAYLSQKSKLKTKITRANKRETNNFYLAFNFI